MVHLFIAAKDYWGTCRAEFTGKTFEEVMIKNGLCVSNTSLLGRSLNRDSFLSMYKSALGHLSEPGSRVVVVSIGHGNQFPDQNGDEEDGLDEGYHLPDGIILDDTLTALANEAECHPTSLLVLISDHCSSGTMLDRQYTRPGKHWVNIASSRPYEDSLASGDGNAMLCGLMNYLEKKQHMLSVLTVRDVKMGLIEEMRQSWVGELQHPTIEVSSDDIWMFKMFG